MPFGVNTSRFGPSLAVLDKSFLDAVGSAQLQYDAQNGWMFAIPEALMYELLRKRDDWRTRNLLKLHRIQKSLVLLPGIGEMFRAEARELKPATSFLRAHRVELLLTRSSTGELFRLTGNALRSVEERTANLKAGLPSLVEVWRSIGSMPELRDATAAEIPKKINELSQQVRDDRKAMRKFYGNNRHPTFPAAELIDEQWAFFRWIQVYLIAGLDFLGSYGLKAKPNPEKLLHERIDLDYTIPALLVGGLACCEKRIKRRFKLLRPDGFLLPDP